MELISVEELKKHMIHVDCDKGCGYIDERDLNDIPKVSVDRLINKLADMSDYDAYGDYQLGTNYGLMLAAKVVKEYFGMED